MSAPVKHTCPDIDKVIKMVKSIQDVAKDGMKAHDRNTDDYERYKDIEWEIDDIIGRMEDLRSSNDELRKWGEELNDELQTAADTISELETRLETQIQTS